MPREKPTSSPNLDSILSSGQLPALPQSAIRVLELSKDPNNGPAEFAVPIESDPGLTGQVLRFVNSSYFGFSREISSVKLAITLVGVRTIKNFTLWSAVFSLMPNPKCGAFDLKSLWQDSLRRGLFARAVGLELGLKEADDLFAAALLQDMALPLLVKERPDDYRLLLEQREGGKRRLSELEREAFGWTHADAAGKMARQWDLPENLAMPIERHTQTIETAGGDAPIPELAVALSSLLPVTIDDTWTDFAQFERTFHQVWPAKARSIAELFGKIDRELEEFAPVMQMATPAKTLAETYEELKSVATGV
jgi:HD-like signal output (HDOD) protein